MANLAFYDYFFRGGLSKNKNYYKLKNSFKTAEKERGKVQETCSNSICCYFPYWDKI